MTRLREILVICLLAWGRAAAQQLDPPAESPEQWNLYYQATSIGQDHGTFRSPYSGPLSLDDTTERDASLTTTLFFGLRLHTNTYLYFNPEIAGGKGFSGVNGMANPSNGEIPRVATATPKPYIARLYIAQDFGFGSEKEHFDSDQNQLAGDRPMKRYSIYIGRFTLTDFFDNNAYSHDPRTQFLAWGLMYNGAWDYPADVRGYTWGWVHEFHTKHWAFRFGQGGEPRVANGPRFDKRILDDHGDVYEVERRYSIGERAGAIRVMHYRNHADAGNYASALLMEHPDVTASRKPGTLKYGFGVNFEQAISKDIGVFSRLGWNDGKTESFAFTAIDRLATAGVSIKGTRWHRNEDTFGTAFAASGASGVHVSYLTHGGLDFLIGDGKLNYAPEYLWETYYSARVVRGFYATFNVQHYNNLAFNHDRGPLWVASARLHIDFGVKPLQAK